MQNYVQEKPGVEYYVRKEDSGRLKRLTGDLLHMLRTGRLEPHIEV
jgi:hypothetical protein